MKTAMRRIRSFLDGVGPLVTLLTILVWILIVFRAMPVPFADFGMFATVADRLNAGDKLYSDVFENKDPFAHYSLALVRHLSPIAAWPLHVVYLLLACIAIFVISKRLSASNRHAAFLGLVCAPIILTGSMFGAGTSHMPGIAICLWIAALGVMRFPGTIGVLLGLVPFFKIVMLPIAAVIVLCDVYTARKRSPAVLRLSIGFFFTLFLLSSVVIIRGEFLPWISALRWNAGYASAFAPKSILEAARFHLSTVLVPTTLLILTAGILLSLISWVLLRTSWDPNRQSAAFRLLLISSTSYGIGLAIVAMTGLWPHHGLVFMIPLSLSLVLFSISMRDQLPKFDGGVLIVTGAATILLSGLPSASAYLDPIIYFRANSATYFNASPEAKLIMSTGTPTKYARVGGGNGPDHAYGLNDWKLACPFFTQFTWESASVLNETLNCLPRASVILVEANIPRNTNSPDWNAFVRAVDDLLDRDYVCREAEAGRICRR